MAKKTIQSITGTLIAIQEERFRLETENGEVYLLTIANRAPVDYRQMVEWYQNNVPVTAQFQGESNTVTGIVHIVRPAAVSL